MRTLRNNDHSLIFRENPVLSSEISWSASSSEGLKGWRRFQLRYALNSIRNFRFAAAIESGFQRQVCCISKQGNREEEEEEDRLVARVEGYSGTKRRKEYGRTKWKGFEGVGSGLIKRLRSRTSFPLSGGRTLRENYPQLRRCRRGERL